MNGEIAGLAAAVTFGLSAPIAARFVVSADPQLIAALLYLGAALAIAPFALSRRAHERGLQIPRREWPRVLIVALLGGTLAPVLLLYGLRHTGGLSGSLLLNLETVLTLTLAVLVWRERTHRGTWLAGAWVLAGAITLSTTSSGRTHAIGAVLVAAACACWAIDNNLSVPLARWNPYQLVFVKATIACATNGTIAIARGAALPSMAVTVGALALGAGSYGVSVVLDAIALRELGAARESALFATAPFAGALLAPVVGHGHWTPTIAVAGALMAIGVVVLIRSDRPYEHHHEVYSHEHPHSHDEHHGHHHPDGESGRHSHRHTHGELVHTHPWRPDAHHHP